MNGHFNTANLNFYSVLSFYRDEERLTYVKLLKYGDCKRNVKRCKRDVNKDIALNACSV